MERYTVANDIIGRLQERYREIKIKKNGVIKFDRYSSYSWSFQCMISKVLCTLP
jgi:hypothetical protein